MKICFIGPATSSHIKKWCRWFCDQGHEIHVISFTSGSIDNVQVHVIDSGTGTADSDIKKLNYLFRAKKIKKLVDEIDPDIVNVHYASSYGAAAALSGLKNYIVSVWGSDVYDFPRKSIFHKELIKYSLSRAKLIFSTSKAMADETRKYTKNKILVTPFGVDMNMFHPDKRKRNNDLLIVGTVKTLSSKYGIDYLLKGCAEYIRNNPDTALQIRIAGDGPAASEYKELAVQLGIDDHVVWLGRIDQNEATVEWANMDVAIIPSVLDSESFGVSAVEAQACGVPVIISDVPGLMEATLPGKSSIVVKRKNAEAISEALKSLLTDKQKRIEMGKNGREYVLRNFEYNDCFRQIEGFYNSFADIQQS